jgi:hypothetical protein
MTSKEIVVRDRREKHQFSIHNRVFDEWLPIIGLAGYGLYNLYVRMSNKKDERAFPGYKLISEHLGVSKSTVSDYNKLLELCGLIHIDRGDHNTSNQYYILDIPFATQKSQDEIRSRITKSLQEKPSNSALGSALKKLDNWQSLDAHFKRKRKVKILFPNQVGLDFGEDTDSVDNLGGTDSEPPGTPGEPPGTGSEPGVRQEYPNNPNEQPESTNNNSDSAPVVVASAEKKEQSVLLKNMGIFGKTVNLLLEEAHVTTQYLKAWLAHAGKNGTPPGVLVNAIRGGEWPPGYTSPRQSTLTEAMKQRAKELDALFDKQLEGVRL